MKLLLAYKPTAEGRAALDAARHEARRRHATVLLARHVRLADQSPLVPQEQRQRSPETDASSGQDVTKLHEELEAVGHGLRADGIDCEALLLTQPADAAEALLQLAHEEEVGLIVIGTRRRSPVGKLILGSVAQDILLRAECPVLAVKADA